MGIAVWERTETPQNGGRIEWIGSDDANAQRDDPYVPDEHLPGILQALVASRAGLTRIDLDGVGRVEIDTGSLRFHAAVDDWDAFCTVPKSDFRVVRLPADARLSGPGRSLGELFWIAGYYASSGRLPAYANRHEVIRLIHWPNFTRLPCASDAYRLCALLARRPSSIHLASRLAGVDAALAFRFFSAAHAAGVIEMVTRLHDPSDLSIPTDEERATSSSENALGVVLKSLWKKMVGR